MGWAVELRDVSKAFRFRHNAARNLKLRLLGLMHARHQERREEFWALRNVSLAVGMGECVGLIGPNGSGKSTLLRLVAGIFSPTTGRVVVNGRVAPIIELGVGFDPELTGRENVYLNTSLYGLSTAETTAILPRIVAFAGLEEFIDRPTKSYSTGMGARLGFALAAHLDADVLLVDEVLAVGDQRFREKCFERMTEIRRRGTTLVVVSHDLDAVRRLCDRVYLLVRGRLEAAGNPEAVIQTYCTRLLEGLA